MVELQFPNFHVFVLLVAVELLQLLAVLVNDALHMLESFLLVHVRHPVGRGVLLVKSDSELLGHKVSVDIGLLHEKFEALLLELLLTLLLLLLFALLLELFLALFDFDEFFVAFTPVLLSLLAELLRSKHEVLLLLLALLVAPADFFGGKVDETFEELAQLLSVAKLEAADAHKIADDHGVGLTLISPLGGFFVEFLLKSGLKVFLM